MNASWRIPLTLATGLDALALVVLLLSRDVTASWVVAIALHALAFAAAAFPGRASRSQRALMASLTLTLPFLGALVAMMTMATRRRGEVGQVPAREAPPPRALNVADVRRLTDGLSASESLMSGDAEERSATLSMLTRHPDAAAIALLRRAVSVGQADLAVDAALALEELGAKLEVSAAAAHEELGGSPDFDHALADADLLATAIHSGLPDPSSIEPLVADARRGYQRAEALNPERLPEIARRWVLLEMDALSPDGGIAVLDRATAVAGGHQFDALRAELARAAYLPGRIVLTGGDGER